MKLLTFRVYLFFFALFATFLYFAFPLILEHIIRSQMNLKRDGKLFPKWESLPVPIVMRYTFFNVTNAKSAVNGHTINVREVGPYVFK